MIALMLLALVWFARTLDWAEAWRAVKGTSVPVLIAAAVVNLLSVVLKAVRWWVFLRPIDVTSWPLVLRATFTGAALNNVLVANSGEAARAIVVARAAHVPTEKVLATLALDRLFEMVGYVILLAVSVWVFTIPSGLGEARWVAAASLVGMAVLLWYLMRHPADADLPALEGEALFQRVKRYSLNFFRTMAGISTGPRFAAALVISVLIWGVQVATYHLTAVAANFEISPLGTVTGLLAVNLGFATRATPGNVGVFQMMYAVSAAAFGLDRDQATGVAFLIQIQQIVPVTIIGLLASPGILSSRRHSVRPDNILPGEPDPSPQR
ncbi:MAG: lysylphosphatidylglycerol synthase transmembrane domain-containing protein [Gemmatimonadaceae bacterium]